MAEGEGEPHVYCVALPLPPLALHPNARGHRMARANAARAYRREVALTLRVAFGRQDVPRLLRARMDLTFVYPTVRTRDDDNLVAWFKAGRDGLVDAGLVPGDGPEHLTMGNVRSVVLRDRAAHVLLTVTEVASGDAR